MTSDKVTLEQERTWPTTPFTQWPLQDRYEYVSGLLEHGVNECNRMQTDNERLRAQLLDCEQLLAAHDPKRECGYWLRTSPVETSPDQPVAWRYTINSAFEPRVRWGYSTSKPEGTAYAPEPLYARPSYAQETIKCPCGALTGDTHTQSCPVRLSKKAKAPSGYTADLIRAVEHLAFQYRLNLNVANTLRQAADEIKRLAASPQETSEGSLDDAGVPVCVNNPSLHSWSVRGRLGNPPPEQLCENGCGLMWKNRTSENGKGNGQ